MTRKLLLGLALACGAAILPGSALADHGDRDGHDGYRHHDDHDRTSFRIDIGSVLGGPACDRQAVQVWVEPVYQTVVQRVWVPEVTQTVVDRVWVPEHYEWRDVATGDRHHRYVKQQVFVPGYYADQPRTVVVAPGHYEDRPVQQLVTPGHWETRYQEAPGPWLGLSLGYRH